MTHFHHFSILAKQTAETRFFYEKILGLRLVKNSRNQGNLKMPHLFFGDELGRPGSLLTFFMIPKLGHRTDGQQYFDETILRIPEGSLTFWQKRLDSFEVASEQKENYLYFSDPDGLRFIFQEGNSDIPYTNQFADVPIDKQILGIAGITLYVADPAKTIDFFVQFLNVKASDTMIFLDNQEIIRVVPSLTEKRTRFGRGSMDHIALDAGSHENLALLYEKAQEQTWEIEEYVDRGYFKSLYIREPGGLRIEFATSGPGFTIDEPFETLGEKITVPSFLQDKFDQLQGEH